jgi:DNA-directed RNA polymerase beta' subunit
MSRCITSNVWDIYSALGIEAARQFMIEEFMKSMGGINECHAMLLVDRMTCSGTITSISRYTMRKAESGPFGQASFEETLDNFLKAGVYGQSEPTRGVSASIICGKRAPIGSGICDIQLDVDILPTIDEDGNVICRDPKRESKLGEDEEDMVEDGEEELEVGVEDEEVIEEDEDEEKSSDDEEGVESEIGEIDEDVYDDEPYEDGDE